MQYFIKAYMESGGMSPSHVTWGDIEACLRGVTLTICFGQNTKRLNLEMLWGH